MKSPYLDEPTPCDYCGKTMPKGEAYGRFLLVKPGVERVVTYHPHCRPKWDPPEFGVDSVQRGASEAGRAHNPVAKGSTPFSATTTRKASGRRETA